MRKRKKNYPEKKMMNTMKRDLMLITLVEFGRYEFLKLSGDGN